MTRVLSDIRILDNLLALNLNVSLWSARRKMSQEDLGGAELPPDDLASLGSKRIANPESLRVFGTLKARAVNYLDRHGVRFMSGWAIPEEKAGEIIQELISIRDDFQREKEDFLASYDQNIQSWIVKHHQWGRIMYGTAWISAGSCIRWLRLSSTRTTPLYWKPAWPRRCKAWVVRSLEKFQVCRRYLAQGVSWQDGSDLQGPFSFTYSACQAHGLVLRRTACCTGG